MIHVADTHAVIWFLEGDARLSAAARDVLAAPGTQLVIPAIVLAEIAYLYAKHRVALALDSVLDHIARTENCTIYPLDEVVVEHLPANLNIHDAIIVATAIVFRDVLHEDAAVITKDRAIAASGAIETLW